MSSGTQPGTPAKPAVFPTMWNNKRAAFAFLAPAVAALALIGIFPTVFALVNSFRRYNLAKPRDPTPFVGFDNYLTVLYDPSFWGALGRTLHVSGHRRADPDRARAWSSRCCCTSRGCRASSCWRGSVW